MTDQFPTLFTDRLRLRQFSEADLDHVFQGLSHPEVIKYYGVSFDSREATKGQLSWYAELETSGTGRWWAICDKQDETFLGAGGFNGLDAEHKKAEIGFWLLPDFWGKGYMQEAMPKLCNHGFEALDLHRIEAYTDPENLRVRKALSKLGFRHEGTMIDYELKDGKFISQTLYALLEHENAAASCGN